MVMRAAIGKEDHPPILQLKEFVQIHCPAPDDNINVAPARDFITCYDLCIKVAAGKNKVKLVHQAFCKWYLKLQEADAQALIYPWTSCVRDDEGILIKNLMDIPTALPLLKMFAHKLFYIQWAAPTMCK